MIGGIAAAVALILFITAHEAGHYFAAKAFKMKVTEFFLGFGPRIWSFRRGETEYGVKPIPLGAYVKVVGMSALEDVDPEDEPRTYRGKPFWQKSIVVLAGVAANFLIAFLLFAGIALAEGDPVLEDGEPVPIPVVAAVVSEYEGQPTAAMQAGLEGGDTILAVDGAPVVDWRALQEALQTNPGREIELLIERDGTEMTVRTTLGSRADPDTGETVGFLGFHPQIATESIGLGTATVRAGRQVVEAVELTFVSFGRLLRLDTLGQLVGGVLGGEVDDEVRPVSPIGIVQIGSQAGAFGIANFLFILGLVNVILGTLNALPLYPLDGGHFAVALYERVTGRVADVRKLIPIALAVIGLLSLIGLIAILLDIVNPIRLS